MSENKTIIERALADLFDHGNVAAVESLLCDDFVHHNPGLPPLGKAEWLAAVRGTPVRDLQIEVLHLLEDGDHVVMYSRRRLPRGVSPEPGVVDIWRFPGMVGANVWRFEDGRIAEHWEVWQPVTA